MNVNELIERVNKCLEEVEIPITKFCKKFHLSTTAFYRWRRGDLDISRERLHEIDAFLTKLNY